jgi:hypothetical protein
MHTTNTLPYSHFYRLMEDLHCTFQTEMGSGQQNDNPAEGL